MVRKNLIIQIYIYAEILKLGTLLPHSTDCNKFYHCFSGIAYEGNCPGELYFNPITSSCDYPSNVECKDKPEDDEEIVCPPPSETLDFIASKIRCDWYYICIQGVPSRQQCAENFHWNDERKRCEEAETANCQIGLSSTSAPSSTASPSSTTVLPPSSSTSEVPEEDEKVECPSQQDIEFIGSKVRCDWYYICLQGVPSRLTCAVGLHWCDERKQCESSETANCQIGLTSTVSPSSTIAPSEFDKYCNKNDIHYLPHPFKCNEYILCFDGNAVPQVCAPGLNFNLKTNRCVPKREAPCVSDGTICGNDETFVLENIYDCNSFYLCFNGSPVPLQCAPGQDWDQEKEICVVKGNSNCRALTYPYTDLNVDFVTCRSTGKYLMHIPKSGTIYILCDNGTPQVLDFSAPIPKIGFGF
uniref:CSON015610 protein n=1 Tax=Culicoides sonorensis TaxID=179676 RepID=A0A336K6H2_CULSO